MMDGSCQCWMRITDHSEVNRIRILDTPDGRRMQITRRQWGELRDERWQSDDGGLTFTQDTSTPNAVLTTPQVVLPCNVIAGCDPYVGIISVYAPSMIVETIQITVRQRYGNGTYGPPVPLHNRYVHSSDMTLGWYNAGSPTYTYVPGPDGWCEVGDWQMHARVFAIGGVGLSTWADFSVTSCQ